MLMKSFLVGGVLALCFPLALEAASQPTPAPMAPAFLTAQASHPTAQPSSTPSTSGPAGKMAGASGQALVEGTPTAVPTPVATLIPTAVFAAANLSPTVDADGDSVVAEEVGESGQVAAQTVSPDLLKLDSETLASLANGIDSETQELLFDPKTKQSLSEAMPGAWKVSVDALYYELARRTLADNKDKAARQSFALALFKDAERAKNAKDLAFEDHSADVVIAQLEGGRASARMDLQKLAEKGNRKARLYLGMDKPQVREEAGALSGSAQAQSTTAAAVGTSSSAAVAAPLPVTPMAASGAAPTPVSAVAVPALSPSGTPVSPKK